MVAAVQNRANLENFSGTVTSANIRDYLNEALQGVYDELVAARGQEFFRKDYTLTTVPNQPAYPLPSDFYELISVDILLSQNWTIAAKPYMESERNMFRWMPGWYYNTPVYYRLLGNPQNTGAAIVPPTINFIPYPPSSVPVVMHYYPIFNKFATDGSQDSYVFDGVNGWEAYAIWLATAMALEKLERDPTFALTMAQDAKERIQAMASDRHAGNPERVQDVSVADQAWGFPWGGV
jgi:hypothetical protein